MEPMSGKKCIAPLVVHGTDNRTRNCGACHWMRRKCPCCLEAARSSMDLVARKHGAEDQDKKASRNSNSHRTHTPACAVTAASVIEITWMAERCLRKCKLS